MASTSSHHFGHQSTAWRMDRRLAGRCAPLQDSITSALQKYRTLVVVGLSSKVSRPSYGVAAYMQQHGYRIIPVNPNEDSVLGERAYATLESVPDPVEIVVIFRQSQHVASIVESALLRRARVIWMQEGVTHDKAAARARSAGLEVIEDRCILKEHARRFVSEGL